jgi:hypothetical protein
LATTSPFCATPCAGEDEVGDVARVSTRVGTAARWRRRCQRDPRCSRSTTTSCSSLSTRLPSAACCASPRLDKSRFDVGPDLQRTLDSSITANVTGATHNGTHVFVVVGSNVVHVLDPYTLLEISSFRCTYDNKPVGMLSELEWIHGRLWANHGVENEILVIQPDTGVVVAFVNVKRFNQAPEPGCCFCGVPIARGIAYNARLDALYLTGRYWPYIYQIKVKYMELDGQLITVGAAMPVAKAADEIAMIDDDPTHRHVVDSSSSSTSTLTYVVVVSIVIAIVVGIYLYRQRQAQQSAATSHNL